MKDTRLPDIDEILAEDARRHRRRFPLPDQDSGSLCSGPRVGAYDPQFTTKALYLPAAMTRDPEYAASRRSREAFDRLRQRYDFEYWALTCCNIHDKTTGSFIPFRLNMPQMLMLRWLERDRTNDNPMRMILLKARQWGGSTLVQMYMAWIQCTIRRNWHSLICAHVKDTSASIRGIYSEMLSRYPAEYWTGDEGSQPAFRPFERAANIREIAGRGCRVTLGSSENHEAVRGGDYAMAHLSEVAFWSDSARRSPEEFVTAVCGAINRSPMTLIVMESTANGVGNYFHSEWKRAERGESDKRPLFVPWYYIDIYRTPLKGGAEAARALWESLDEYELRLWTDAGVTLDQLNWYHHKRLEYPDHALMKAEYPTYPDEAFANTGNAVFNPADIERLRHGCIPPVATGDFTGPVATGPRALEQMKFTPGPPGSPMKVWRFPARGREADDERYLVTVDIGGRSAASDFSVIAVFDRRGAHGRLELVAQWRGHCDHDILAWKAAAIARSYAGALLVVESNTLETDNTEGDPSGYILNHIRRHYDHLYHRPGGIPGFHTNRASKTAIITRLNSALRDGTLIERDNLCCDELMTFRNHPNGSQGAAPGHHDDTVITRAMALHIHSSIIELEGDTDISGIFGL